MPAVADRPKVKPSKLPEPFTPASCERIRHLSRLRADAITSRDAAFKNRDAIEGQIAQCNDAEADKKDRLKSECYDEIHAINHFKSIIKMADEQIAETIRKADQHELFTDDVHPTVDDLFSQAEKAKATSNGKVIAKWRTEKVGNHVDDAKTLGVLDDLKITTVGEFYDYMDSGKTIDSLGKAKLDTLTKAMRAARDAGEADLKT